MRVFVSICVSFSVCTQILCMFAYVRVRMCVWVCFKKIFFVCLCVCVVYCDFLPYLQNGKNLLKAEEKKGVLPVLSGQDSF